MLIRKIQKLKIIQSKDPKEVEKQFEEVLESIGVEADYIRVDYDSNVGHYAHIRWTKTITEPENVRDEYILNGKRYCCGDCPFFVLQKDRRIKYSLCEKNEKTWFEHDACLKLYEMIDRGEVEL